MRCMLRPGIAICMMIVTGMLFAAETEPNNIADEASTLALGVADNGAHDATDSTDWWKVITTMDGTLTITVSDPTTDECVGLQLFEQNATTLLKNNGSCGYSNYVTAITYNNLAPATYYIMATRGRLPGASYTITAEFTPESLAIDTEPNNVRDSALALTLNGSVTGHLGFLNGVLTDTIAWDNGKRDNIDWWKVTAAADGRLRVSVKSTASLCVQLRIRTSADTVGSLDNNGSCGYSTYRDYVEVKNLAPGTYFVEAWDANWKYNTNYGAYTLACSLYTNTAPNDSEPNDYAAQAKALSLNDSTAGHLGYYYGDVADTIAWINGKRDNVDWWKMVFAQRGKISVTVSSDPTLCVQMGLRSSADTVNDLKGNGSCGYSNYTSTLDYFVTAGAYYLVAYDPSWKYNTKYGAYRLKTVYTLAPAASFDAMGEGTVYSFINTTAGATGYSWNFGDNASSTLKNPQHTYANPGVFTVTLIARNDAGDDTTARQLTLKGLHKVEAGRAGNTGDATVYIYGGGFKAASSVYLVKSGQTDIAAAAAGMPRPGMLRAQFDLRGAPVGIYSVRVTTPGDSAMNLTNAFTVEAGRAAEPGVAVVGRDRILFNRWQTYTISYWNSSNIDAHGVPLWIAMSDLPDSQVQIVDFSVVLPKMAVDSGLTRIKDSVPIFYLTDSLFGSPFFPRDRPKTSRSG
jgi:PKD repeat protein